MDRLEHFHRRLQFAVAARDGFERLIAPTRVLTRITHSRCKLRAFQHGVLPIQFEQFLQSLGILAFVLRE